MSLEEHKASGERLGAIRCAVITVSDTRTIETDTSGQEIVRQAEAAGHEVLERTVVPDDPAKIRLVLHHWLREEVDAILLNGGTGLAPRDGTVEVVEDCLDRVLPGFGELFRMLSYDEIGAAAMLSRATAGVSGGKVVFSLPGSRKAVRLALERLILPELGHLVSQVRGMG